MLLIEDDFIYQLIMKNKFLKFHIIVILNCLLNKLEPLEDLCVLTSTTILVALLSFATNNTDVTDTTLKDWYLAWGGVTAALPMLVTIIANIILLVQVFDITRRMGEALPNRGQ